MARTRDWSSMREMSTRLLEERTGTSLRTWNARVKKLAPKDEAALRAWLDEEGVAGYAQSLLVWERFGYPDFLVADAEELIDAQYEKRPALRPIYDAIVEAAAGLGDVTIQARKTYVSLVGPKRTFARVQAAKAHVALALRLDGAKPRGRLKASRIHESMPVQVDLDAVEAVDGEVLTLLQRAYDDS